MGRGGTSSSTWWLVGKSEIWKIIPRSSKTKREIESDVRRKLVRKCVIFYVFEDIREMNKDIDENNEMISQTLR